VLMKKLVYNAHP